MSEKPQITLHGQSSRHLVATMNLFTSIAQQKVLFLNVCMGKTRKMPWTLTKIAILDHKNQQDCSYQGEALNVPTTV